MTLYQTSFGISAIYRYFGARESLKLADNHISAVKQVSGHIEYIKPYPIITLGGVGRGFVTLSHTSFGIFAIYLYFGVRVSIKLADNYMSDVEQLSGHIKYIIPYRIITLGGVCRGFVTHISYQFRDLRNLPTFRRVPDRLSLNNSA